MSDFCVVLCSCPSESSAEEIASKLVENKLAACVHLSAPIKSFFFWEGKTCQETEYQLWIKTKKAVYTKLQEQILELHPYEVPQILSMPIDQALPAYLHWLKEEVSE